jgi:delta(3,5)-delta(2,4)-dienoyl-CoA isomerase
MFINLSTAFDRLSQDPAVRCIILSGAGERAFTSGLDVS